MFDPNFNPLAQLQQLAKNQETAGKNIIEIARAINHQAEQLQDLHNRIQLLEMARQHEQKTTTN